jgi:hypothetical protein
VKAQVADIPRIVGMARKFHEAHRPAWGFDPMAAAAFFQGLIDSPNGLVLVTDEGFAAAVAVPNPFDPEWLTVSELLMWAQDGRGASLWRGMKTWAAEIGAREIRFSCHPENQRVARFMARIGRADEITYSEVLPCV